MGSLGQIRPLSTPRVKHGPCGSGVDKKEEKGDEPEPADNGSRDLVRPIIATNSNSPGFRPLHAQLCGARSHCFVTSLGLVTDI
jgi:hypothetical protein